MHLLQCLLFFKACYQFSLQAVHVEGIDNAWADPVSWNNFDYLHSQVFHHCDPLPKDLVTPLVVEQPDWAASRCTQLFGVDLALAMLKVYKLGRHHLELPGSYTSCTNSIGLEESSYGEHDPARVCSVGCKEANQRTHANETPHYVQTSGMAVTSLVCQIGRTRCFIICIH